MSKKQGIGLVEIIPLLLPLLLVGDFIFQGLHAWANPHSWAGAMEDEDGSFTLHFGWFSLSLSSPERCWQSGGAGSPPASSFSWTERCSA